jgi:hypothetical protein
VKSFRNPAILLVLLAAAPLGAQPAPTPEPEPDQADASLTGSVTANLTVPEMVAQLDELDKQTEEDARYVLRLQIQARKEKDVIKLNCINDKLLQIKALRNIIEGAKLDFDTATGNADEQQYQFSRVTLSADNIRQLREEANACAGEVPDTVGETVTDWTGPDLPDDPTDPFGQDIEPPGYASPFN